MTTYLDYINYFQQIAIDLLGHSDSEKHFFRKGLEEFLNGLQTSVNYPALLMDKYDFKYNDNGSDDVNKVRSIAFLLIDNAKDTEDYERIDNIYNDMELIVDKIINRIRRDIHHPKNDFLKFSNMNNIEVTPVNNYADGNYGYFVTVDIYSHHNASIYD